MSRVLLSTAELRGLRRPNKKVTRKDVAVSESEAQDARGHGGHLTLKPENCGYGGLALHGAHAWSTQGWAERERTQGNGISHLRREWEAGMP